MKQSKVAWGFLHHLKIEKQILTFKHTHMKFTLLLVLISIFSFGNMTLKSQNISANEAETAAINFYNYHVIAENSIKPSIISKADISLVKTDKINLYYIVNIKANGFVIISAQSNVYPVLAYSTKNAFSKTNIPDNVQVLLNGYSEQIIHAVKSCQKAGTKTEETWINLMSNSMPKLPETSVVPLLTSSWDQNVPYNEYCPEDENGPGGHVLTGCPATAMAQLMYYYRYPEQGTGSNSYYQYPYDTISADFENAYYDYNAMTNVSNANNYEEVAELSFHAGVAINTVYGPTISGVYFLSTVVDGLENHFAYSEDAQLVFKTGYTQDEWESMIRDDLDLLMPVIYCAVDLSAGGGHTWVCDGYEDDNYFHMNFGWGGSYDGYYYLDDLSFGGYTFSTQHQMIMDIFPADASYPDFCTGTTHLSTFDGTFTDGSGPYNYEDNSSCSWLIDTQTTEDSVTSISLNFDKFDTEITNDTLTIYDGNSVNSSVIAVLSGNDASGTYTSTGNKMFVTFCSNSTITDTGWMASYQSNMAEYCSGMVVLNDEFGTISDGSGNFNYNSNSICMWSIEPYLASSITAHFTYFETEENYDFLKIYDDGDLIGSFSGSEIPPDITAESGKMFIAFNTNSSNNFNGWEIEYTAFGVDIQETTNENYTISLFPNPVNNIINIKIDPAINDNTTVIMINAIGQSMLERKLKPSTGPSEFKIDCSSYCSGIYLIKLINETQILTKKIIIQ
ncbi:MAG: C10 family peptidase [Bacteroidales bacterium]|nr:C10 family peptidase [Bacteroidales bacterium]